MHQMHTTSVPAHGKSPARWRPCNWPKSARGAALENASAAHGERRAHAPIVWACFRKRERERERENEGVGKKDIFLVVVKGEKKS